MADVSTVQVLLPLATTAGGVAAGWWLGVRTAKSAARDAREWQERQAVRQHQDHAAAELAKAMLEISRVIPKGPILKAEAGPSLAEARWLLQIASKRTAVLADIHTEELLDGLDLAIYIAWKETQGGSGELENYGLFWTAFNDIGATLIAFQRHEELPDQYFPTRSDMVAAALRDGEDTTLDSIRRLLSERYLSPGRGKKRPTGSAGVIDQAPPINARTGHPRQRPRPPADGPN